MKKTTIVSISALLLLFIVGCASSAKQYGSAAEWIAESMVPGNRLPLGTKAGEWSNPKVFNATVGTIQVRSEFIKHHGSTCHFNVEFKNVGQSEIDSIGGLTTQEQVNVYGHNSARLRLAPGKSVTFDDLEARECPIRFGTSTDMNACAACQAWIVFTK